MMKGTALSLLASATLLFSSASAQTVVISQVYGGGGNSGAPYMNDFIELFNPTSAPVDLTGWSVQYAAAASANWSMTTLTGTIAAGSYYLIQQSGGASGAPLPSPDASGTTNLSATAGKILLSDAAVAFMVMCPTVPSIVDFVGYGATANCYEGGGPAPAPSNTLSVHRADSGCTDSNNNAPDFSSLNPVPRNSSYSYTCFPTSAEESDLLLNSVVVYPNPANETCTMYNVHGAIWSIDVYDALGNLIMGQQLGDNRQRQITFNVSGWKSGIYFVLLKSEQKVSAVKFVIAR
jgi:predicted extracellular nuclease